MKKALAAILLSIIFTSQVGYYFVYTIHQHIVKEEIEEELLANISDSSLEIIIAEEFGDRIKWEEEGKEFSLDGELYDICRTKTVDGKTLLYCINDKKEKQILDNLVKAVNKNSDNKRGRVINPVLPDLVFINLIEPFDLSSVSSQYAFLNVTLVSSFEEITSPPPKA